MDLALPELRVPLLGPTDRLVGLTPLFLRDAVTGGVPRLRTALRAGLRGGVLCVRFDGRDDGVVATLTGRDAPLWREDVFEIFLSPEDPARTYFEFEVNPLGTLFDARVESPNLRREGMRVATEWDCDGFSARATVRPGRWSATVRIPLAPLCGGAPPPRWRTNFCRIDRGPRDEYSAWSPALSDPPDFHVPERFGILSLP
ncbi:MAG TPA: carbohydrate-binding family 9-like protein [Thermoanaerobaculia bacterium]|nr:carbohydrate-binding family 9-like protein [Thermoanaerobaculia bacterium]